MRKSELIRERLCSLLCLQLSSNEVVMLDGPINQPAEASMMPAIEDLMAKKDQ